MNKTLSSRIADFLIYLVMILILIATLYPFYYCFIMSFNEGHDSRLGGIYFFPRIFTLENYKTVFTNDNILQAFLVTVARTVIGAVTSVFFTAMIAYGLSKRYILFRKVYSIFFLITMFFAGGLIPFYFLLKGLHLLDNFLVFILPVMSSYFNILLFMAFYSGIPPSLEESSKIDGANEFYVFLKIILPLSLPVIATIALFNGVGQWNSWFDSAVFTNGGKLTTLPVLLIDIMNFANNQELINQKLALGEAKITPEAIRYATMMVAVIPITLVYPFLQKYFVKGMMVGAVKG